MKTSHRFLLTALLFLCIVVLIEAFLIRKSMAVSWKRTDENLSAHLRYEESDSIRIEAPPPQIPWYEVTLGLDTRRPMTEWSGSRTVLSDLGLVLTSASHSRLLPEMLDSQYDPGSYWTGFLPREPEREDGSIFRRNSRTLYFHFKTGESAGSAQSRHSDDRITIMITKHSNPQPDSTDDFLSRDTCWVNPHRQDTTRISNRRQISSAGLYQVTHFLKGQKELFYSRILWRKGFWKVAILFNTGPDPVDQKKFRIFRNRVRDRLFEYFRSLHGTQQTESKPFQPLFDKSHNLQIIDQHGAAHKPS